MRLPLAVQIVVPLNKQWCDDGDGGDDGPAVVPNDADKSLLIKAVKQTGDLKMPPKGAKLTDSEIADLVAWVNHGAVTDPDEAAQPILAVAKGEAGDEFFENKIRPILSTECGSCHQASSGGGLSMLSREAMIKGGDMGPAIVPGAAFFTSAALFAVALALAVRWQVERRIQPVVA